MTSADQTKVNKLKQMFPTAQEWKIKNILLRYCKRIYRLRVTVDSISIDRLNFALCWHGSFVEPIRAVPGLKQMIFTLSYIPGIPCACMCFMNRKQSRITQICQLLDAKQF